MNPLKCLVVDDESLAHRVLENYVDRCPELEIVGYSLNAGAALEVLNAKSVDLMFLDIHMPRVTGLNFLGSLENPPLTILTTAYENYALDSYQFDVADYLLKPIEFERFQQAIEKVQRRLADMRSSSSDHESPAADAGLFIRSEGNTHRILFNEICYIEAMGDYTKLTFSDGKRMTCHEPLRFWEERLPATKFVRVHRAFMVSLEQIVSLKGKSEITIGSTTVPVGRTYRKLVGEAISHRT
ncbi:MAG: LytR/AlgR family response regulator transcription factor [Opitutaceae bacterium]